MARSTSRETKRNIRAFFDEGKALAAKGDPAANCWLCGDRIDYEVEPNSTPDSHNRDHFYPVSTHPELQEDPANWRHSHRLCNEQRGNRSPDLEITTAIPRWW